MEDDHYPSLPSNYLSLVQLQERWLKEQQRKQREKEEQERKNREEEEDQQKRSRIENGDKGLDNSVSVTRQPFRRNRWKQGTRDRRTVEVSKPKLEESKIEAVVCQDEQKKDELKERDKRIPNKRRKPRVGENLAGGTSQLAPVEKPEVIVMERNGENEEIGSPKVREPKVREPKVREPKVREPKVREPKVPVDQKASVERNFEELSLNEGKERLRSPREINADRQKYSRGSERAESRKQRDCNLVWVRKGEITGTDINGIQSSGTSVKAGVDKKKKQQQQPGHSKQKYRTRRD